MNQKSKAFSLHFVGIGGIGMSGIAEVFFNHGYSVSGSDLRDGPATQRLADLGITIHQGHEPQNIEGASVVVISSAVKSDNPEVLEAKKRRIPVIPRAEMLGELMRGKTGIAVAGTHGKTTTSSMLATVLRECGKDPTVVIGGVVQSLGGNAVKGESELVVAEADESDGSFLHLPALYSVVTNIDTDHMDHYGSIERLDQTFVDFVGKLPFYGAAVVCGDDLGVQRCMSHFTKPIITYGLQGDWNFVAHNIRPEGMQTRFSVMMRSKKDDPAQEYGEFLLPRPGRHNVLNALAAIAMASHLGLTAEEIAKGLATYQGVSRRLEICFHDPAKKIMIMDDYAHHPTELKATLQAIRSTWEGRVIGIFQPHRYSRTLHSREGFWSAFSDCDVTWVTDIYAAGEDPIEGITSENLVQEMKSRGSDRQEFEFVGSIENAHDQIIKKIQPGDLVVCLGAGSITQLPRQITATLEAQSS